MLRANIYSLEPLPQITREAVIDGIGMTAAHMGETVAVRELRVRLPLNEQGNVNPRQVGLAKLDKLVELHLMAVPLDPGEGERVGLAAVGRGWSFVDTSCNNDQLVRSTTGHEISHSLGFVTPGSQQEDPESLYHCCKGNCIMHKTVTTIVNEMEDTRTPNRLRLFRGRMLNKRPPAEASKILVVRTVRDQHDFCLDCKVDMRDNGEKNIQKLRHGRLFEWKSV